MKLVIEEYAQHYAARLLALDTPGSSQQGDQGGDYQEIDVSSLELIRPRSVGVEHVGVAALTELRLPQILEDAGLNFNLANLYDAD